MLEKTTGPFDMFIPSAGWARLPRATLAATVLVSACVLPDYRVELSNLPSSTTSLEVMVFPNTMTTLASPKVVDPLPVASVPSTGKLSFTLDLVDDLDKAPMVVSVAARDSSGCIVAVGSVSSAAPAGLQVRAVPVDLVTFKPPVTTDRCRPKANEATLLSVQRLTQGPYQGAEYQLLLYGWNLHGTHAPVVKSSAPIVYGGPLSNAPANLMCDPGPCMGIPTLGGTMCKTGCTLDTTATGLGSALITLTFKPINYTLPLVQKQDAVVPYLSTFPLTVQLDPGAMNYKIYPEGQASY
jgi:hypothetical protein